jgi:hypothetical protein
MVQSEAKVERIKLNRKILYHLYCNLRNNYQNIN